VHKCQPRVLDTLMIASSDIDQRFISRYKSTIQKTDRMPTAALSFM